MEFVTQLWAYKSDRFLLGVECPEIIKNHIWLLLIVAKTALVGCSVMHLTQPDLFNKLVLFQVDAAPATFQGADGETTLRFKLSCLNDEGIQTQLYRYYYTQSAILLFLGITYARILRSGVSLMGSDEESNTLKGFDPNSQIEFMNNTIKIKRDDPRRQRDRLLLKSSTGALLALFSIMATLFSLFYLLPAVYSMSCHSKHSWQQSQYPGVSFALTEALLSISCLCLLLFATVLTFLLDYLPRFFLRTLPSKFRQCRRRLNKRNGWKPNNYSVDYGLDQQLSKEYDCTQLSENFDGKNLSRIEKDQSTFYMNMSNLNGSSSSPYDQTMNLSLLTKLV